MNVSRETGRRVRVEEMSRAASYVVLMLAWCACVGFIYLAYRRGDFGDAMMFKLCGGMAAVLLAIFVPMAVASRQEMGQRQRGFEVQHHDED